MKKTKVVCTMGPRTDDRNMMRALIKNGMDVARFNFSHGSYDEHKRRMDMLIYRTTQKRKEAARKGREKAGEGA